MYTLSDILGRHSHTYRHVTTKIDRCMNSTVYNALDKLDSLPIPLRSISSLLQFRKEVHTLYVYAPTTLFPDISR